MAPVAATRDEPIAEREVMSDHQRVTAGLISDTHGLLRPEVFEAFRDVQVILHAGDVGGLDILTQLQTIAPVHAVYGNVDAPGEPGLSARLNLRFDDVTVHVSHGHELGTPAVERLAARYDADVIVFGHTHRALIERVDGHRLVINPGAAGPRRFDVKPSVAVLTLDNGRADARLIWL
jgi:putative phosphoesterase